MVVKKDDGKLKGGHENLSLEEVRRRMPLLKRVALDAMETYESRQKHREFLDELIVISKKFSSPEINETMGRLRREIVEFDRDMEGYDQEVQHLGGFLEDAAKGLAYFYSERDGREIYFVWDMSEPELVFWHGREESFSDRLPIEFPEGSQASR